ncbi:MAG: hypothetical protein P9E67_04890 [Candidatus Competibacter sp.]|nr:hypothetical protein [Candidatus Competibacter sp.]
MTTQYWLAAAYDSDEGFALGESAEAAIAAYCEKFWEPSYGFSIITDRASYKRELERIGIAMGYAEKSIPLFRADEWITVSPLGEGAAEVLEGKKSSSFLIADWSRDDGKFFIVLPKKKEFTGQRTKKPLLEPINGIAPSERQQVFHKQGINWVWEMDWNARAEETNAALVANGQPPRYEKIDLTAQEISYVRALYASKRITQDYLIPQSYR